MYVYKIINLCCGAVRKSIDAGDRKGGVIIRCTFSSIIYNYADRIAQHHHPNVVINNNGKNKN